MKTKLLLLLAWWLVAGWPSAQAQLEQTLRREFALKETEDEDIYDVTAVGKSGLLLSSRKNNLFSHGHQPWTFQRYDTTLQLMWSKEVLINSAMLPLKSYHNQQYHYILFSEPEKLDISVFRLSIETGESEMIEGSLVAGIEVTEFKVLDNQAYIGGIVKNRPVVIAFSFFDRRPRVLPSLFGQNSEITSIQVNDSSRTVSVIMYTLVRNTCKLTVKTYSYGNKLIDEVAMRNEKDISLVTGKLSPLNENERLLLGNYSSSCSPYSQGMYMAKLNNYQREFIHYFKFVDFKNFFNYMKPARQQRVKNRILKKREKGKELRLHYRLLIHDVIETPEQFIMVAEAYYPQYRSSSFGAYSGRGVYSDRIFDGYRYTHAVVCGFDKQGRLLWDNSFEILDYSSYDLKELVQVSIEKDRVVLAYPQDGTINTKVIQGSSILKNKENYKILTNYENDKVVQADAASVAHWYDHYFIAWGFQKINNNRDDGVVPQREVFYLNKITYQESEDKQGKTGSNNKLRN